MHTGPSEKAAAVRSVRLAVCGDGLGGQVSQRRNHIYVHMYLASSSQPCAVIKVTHWRLSRLLLLSLYLFGLLACLFLYGFLTTNHLPTTPSTRRTTATTTKCRSVKAMAVGKRQAKAYKLVWDMALAN